MNAKLLSLLLCLLAVARSYNGNGQNNRNTVIYNEKKTMYSTDEPTRQPESINAVVNNEPDETAIKRDLAGRVIVEPTKQQYRTRFHIRSAENVQSVKIASHEKKNNEITYFVHLLLTDGVNQYKADANITYAWSNKGWEIQYIESKYLDIVSTGKFNNCILVKEERRGFSNHLYWYNNCDVTLIVEGYMFAWSSDGQKREWRYFADEVPANGKADFYYETEVDYKIMRIERP
jgi:hypothetical protein